MSEREQWASEVVAAHRMAAKGKEFGTEGLKGGKYVRNVGTLAHFTSRGRVRQVAQEQKRTAVLAVLLGCEAW